MGHLQEIVREKEPDPRPRHPLARIIQQQHNLFVEISFKIYIEIENDKHR